MAGKTGPVLTPGQLVKSKAGHDRGDIFIVVGIQDDQYVFIADGDKRRIENPKKKKNRHLQPYNRYSRVIADMIEHGSEISNMLISGELERSGAIELIAADQEEM